MSGQLTLQHSSIITTQYNCSEAEQVIQDRLAGCVTAPGGDGQTPSVRPHYILQYLYVEDVATRRAPHRAAHLALAAQYKLQGKIVMDGALADLSGAEVIFRSREDAETFVAEDPYVKNGVVTSHEVREWSVVV